MDRKLKLTRLTVAWLLGIGLSGWLNPPLAPLLLVSTPIVALIVLWWKETTVRCWAIYALVCILGACRYQMHQPQIDPQHVAYYNDGGTIVLHGIITGDPDVRDRYANLRLRAQAIERKGHRFEVTGDVLVQAPRYPPRAYGDQVEVTGELETPPELDEFSYKEHLARQGIYSIMQYPEINCVAESQGSLFYATLYGLRARARDVIASIIPEPESSLLAGILLGIESSIDAKTLDAFTVTGTIHIIVISGFNLSLLAGLFVRMGNKLFHRFRACLFALVGVGVYTLFVGAGAPVIRAAIMVSVSLLAYLVGRPYDATSALAGAILAMTFLNPMAPWNASFQLSMAATLGLMALVPTLAESMERRLAHDLPQDRAKRVFGLISELLLATLAAQLATLPIIVYHFQRLSLISLLTNMLVLPVQPAIMTFGGIATLAGLVALPIGQLLGGIPWLFLTYTARVVEWTARPSWASVPLRLEWWMALLYYALLIGIRWAYVHRTEMRQGIVRLGSRFKEVGRRSPARPFSASLVLPSAAILCILIWITILGMPDGRLHVYFLDVGQGDAILIRLPEGQQILVDGGPNPSQLLAALGRRIPFWDHSLDMVVLTHADMDHLGGLIPVLERYQVEHVVHTSQMRKSPPTEYWHELIDMRSMEAIQASQGMRFAWEGIARIDVLHPEGNPPDGETADENNSSIVLRLIFGEVEILLTGDIESEAERQLLRSGQLLSCDVLKVSHHGADESSSEGFLNAVRPALAVISVGADNRHGHPAPATLGRLADCGARIMRTDRDGTIEVISDGSRFWIRTDG